MRLRQLKDSPPHLRAHELGRLKRRYEQLTQHWASLNLKIDKMRLKPFEHSHLLKEKNISKALFNTKKDNNILSGFNKTEWIL